MQVLKPTNGYYADVDLRVRYAETDQLGIVYHANYLVWFEIGRAEYCRQNGFRYTELEDMGYRLVVAEARCRYRNAARYDDVVTVRTSLADLRRRSVTFRYVVFDRERALQLVDGETRHLCTDRSGRSRVIPEPYYTYLSDSVTPPLLDR